MPACRHAHPLHTHSDTLTPFPFHGLPACCPFAATCRNGSVLKAANALYGVWAKYRMEVSQRAGQVLHGGVLVRYTLCCGLSLQAAPAP